MFFVQSYKLPSNNKLPAAEEYGNQWVGKTGIYNPRTNEGHLWGLFILFGAAEEKQFAWNPNRNFQNNKINVS